MASSIKYVSPGEKDYINFETTTGYVWDNVLFEIQRVLCKAQEHNGKPFGGYVRFLLNQRKCDNDSDLRFKDVDVWFQNEEQKDLFVKDFNGRDGSIKLLTSHFQSSIDNNNEKYPFKRYSFNLVDVRVVSSIILMTFDLIVSSSFPVTDFDVNFITSSFEFGQNVFKCESNDFNEKDLIDKIKAKKCMLLDTHLEQLRSKNMMYSHYYRTRLYERFNKKGWEITYKKVVIKSNLDLDDFNALIKDILFYY